MSDLQKFFTQVPRTEVVAKPASGPAYWRDAWLRRHTIAVLPAAAGLLALNLALVPAVSGWVVAALVMVSIAQGIVVASYLPSPGMAATTTCAAAPLMVSAIASWVIAQGFGGFTGVLLALLLGVGALGMRAFGPTACPS